MSVPLSALCFELTVPMSGPVPFPLPLVTEPRQSMLRAEIRASVQGSGRGRSEDRRGSWKQGQGGLSVGPQASEMSEVLNTA